MQKTLLRKFIPAALFFSLLVGCGAKTGSVEQGGQAAPAKASAQAEQNVFKGEVVGVSNKAKTISIKVGKGDAAKTMMLKFDDLTTGMDNAEKGHAAIIKYKVVGKDKIAVDVKPKLAELPKGTSEVKPDYVKELIAKGGNYVLIDSRPAKRFHEGSVPTAVSVPVDVIKKKGASVLPTKDKSAELIFFCGGPT